MIVPSKMKSVAVRNGLSWVRVATSAAVGKSGDIESRSLQALRRYLEVLFEQVEGEISSL